MDGQNGITTGRVLQENYSQRETIVCGQQGYTTIKACLHEDCMAILQDNKSARKLQSIQLSNMTSKDIQKLQDHLKTTSRQHGKYNMSIEQQDCRKNYQELQGLCVTLVVLTS